MHPRGAPVSGDLNAEGVGNVLAVFYMNGARVKMLTSRLTAEGVINPHPDIDLQGVQVEATMGAISEAVTGAYLSSSGNAFSTRTASMIVQQHFPPAPSTAGLESGPLFGVQFSQLPCSDLIPASMRPEASRRSSAPSARRSDSRRTRAGFRSTRTEFWSAVLG